MVDDSQSEYIALAEMEEVVVADKYYSEPEVLEFIFKIPTPPLSDGVKQDIKNSCVKRGHSVPTLESLAPTNMTVSGIISHLVSAGLPCVYSSSGMAFDREEIRKFFLQHDIALPVKLFPASQSNSERKLKQLVGQRQIKASLVEKARARQREHEEQEKRELRRLQLNEARARANAANVVNMQYASVANIPTGHEVKVQEKEPASISPASEKKKRKHTRGEVTQKQAAAMCGVSVRLIQNWLAEKNKPEGFPGLYDPIRFRQWVEDYKLKKVNKAIAVKMNNPISVDPRIIEACHSDSAFLDTPDGRDTRSMEDLIEEQEREMAQDRKRRGRQM